MALKLSTLDISDDAQAVPSILVNPSLASIPTKVNNNKNAHNH
jgi:hypothetical protein